MSLLINLKYMKPPMLYIQTYANARLIGWFVVTTGLITAFPLVFEVTIIADCLPKPPVY